QDRVHGMLVEDPAVAVAGEVELQALQLQAGRLRDIADDDRAEVGLTRLGTDGGELRAGDLDLVVSARELVGEGFDRGSHLDSLAKCAPVLGQMLDRDPHRRVGTGPSQPNRRTLRGVESAPARFRPRPGAPSGSRPQSCPYSIPQAGRLGSSDGWILDVRPGP